MPIAGAAGRECNYRKKGQLSGTIEAKHRPLEIRRASAPLGGRTARLSPFICCSRRPIGGVVKQRVARSVFNKGVLADRGLIELACRPPASFRTEPTDGEKIAMLDARAAMQPTQPFREQRRQQALAVSVRRAGWQRAAVDRWNGHRWAIPRLRSLLKIKKNRSKSSSPHQPLAPRLLLQYPAAVATSNGRSRINILPLFALGSPLRSDGASRRSYGFRLVRQASIILNRLQLT